MCKRMIYFQSSEVSCETVYLPTLAEDLSQVDLSSGKPFFAFTYSTLHMTDIMSVICLKSLLLTCS